MATKIIPAILVFNFLDNWHACYQVVVIAQRLEHRFYTPGAEGSTPSDFTIFLLNNQMIWITPKISCKFE